MALIGRQPDLEIIASLIEGAANGKRAMIVRGEPGIGKTAILEAVEAEARARGTLVYRSSGVETEAGLDFSGLHQLVRPLWNASSNADLEQLRSTFDRTFGLVVGQPVGRFELANAVLELLDRAAEHSRLLLVVDDVQWLDEPSAETLAFIARRIENPNLTMLIGLRSGVASLWDRAGIAEYDVLPLRDHDAAALLDLHTDGFARHVKRRLLAEAMGNPLALVELPLSLTAEQRKKGLFLPNSLPLTRRLELVFAGRVRELSAGSRRLLLLCALDRTGRVDTIRRSAGESWLYQDLVEANDAGVLQLVGQRISFRHPLVRSAIVQLATEHDQRTAHALLANALRDEVELWAWHGAYASDRPDDSLADALEFVARRSLRNGGSRTAVKALQRAIELTADREVRARRLAYAAYLANVTGQADLGQRMLAEFRVSAQFDPPPGGADEATGYAVAAEAFRLMHREGDLDAAYRLLVRALVGSPNTSQGWVAEAFSLLVLVCMWSVRVEYWNSVNEILAALGPDAPLAFVLLRDGLGDPARTAHGLGERLADVARTAHASEPWQVVWLAAGSSYIDNLSAWRDNLRSVIDEEELGGSLSSYLEALVLSTLDSFESGRWNEARELATKGLDTAEEFGFSAHAGSFRSIRAVVAAAQGDVAEARQELSAVQAWSVPRGFRLHALWSDFSELQIHLAERNYEEAFFFASRLTPPGSLAPFEPLALLAFMDTVIAAWRSGRHDVARQHLAAGEEARLDLVSPRLAFCLAACRAFLAAPDQKEALFAAALTTDGIDRWPFDEARVRLTFGEWLRSRNQSVAARPHLRAAVDLFEKLGASRWLKRAEDELRTVGGGRTESRSGAVDSLTPQEREIAELAATGRSNKEIASVLFISPRTVAAHLYRIFPKLDVTSRSALHRALDGESRSGL